MLESVKTYLKQCWNHLKVITKHKKLVTLECWKRGLIFQGLVHDLSKYSFTEFFASARYFQGTSTPIAAEKAAKGYSLAWLHHKGRNKHHWEYWTDFINGEIKAFPIPDKYLTEMVCDMIAASKVYGKTEYNNGKPYLYFLDNSDTWLMEEKSKAKLEQMLAELAAPTIL